MLKLNKSKLSKHRRYVRYTNLDRKSKSSFLSSFKTFIKIFLFTCLLIAIVYGYKFTVSYIYASDNFLIEDIDVSGCNNVTKTEIRELIPFKTGDNLFKVDLSKAEKEMQKCKPELKDISMSRNLMSKKITITLKERNPEVFILRDNEIVGLDFDNMPFALRGNMFDMKVPILKYSSEKERLDLLNFVKIFKPYIKDLIPRITEIKYGEVEDIIFVLDNKTLIFWGSPKEKDIKDKVKKLKIVCEDSFKRYNSVDYIDLTFLDENKNKIIIKPTLQVA
ncbi:MAG: FtsQ-type POTRA domain-containing protein [Endomicrobiia bacterium]|nr:FtsQ-type POTRA domain-containing protein [Endomicrobiaceae bacterium]MDD3053606.1 FtsQ-type POTRA domain-containing protein [Endomicrobiaceae bacterium]MDD3922767.1 FtsQ-type POTRA domain-containing protein [Endomicrobiaceae bacterium]